MSQAAGFTRSGTRRRPAIEWGFAMSIGFLNARKAMAPLSD